MKAKLYIDSEDSTIKVEGVPATCCIFWCAQSPRF